jgi:hypothetical protein
MLGFKRFVTAAVTIRGIELAEKIKKQQFNLKPLTGKQPPLRKFGPRSWPLESTKPLARQIHTLNKIAPEPMGGSARILASPPVRGNDGRE